MIQDGQIVLFSFPNTSQAGSSVRPALILRALPGPHGDWLICMITSRLYQQVADFDEVVRDTDSDFAQTGLKVTSLVRVARLAVVSGDLLHGAIGSLAPDRLRRIRARLARWLCAASAKDDQ